MKRRGLAVLVFVLLALPFVLGATDIKVKTLPGYDVHVNFAQTGDTYSLVKSLNLGKADNDGLAAGVFDEGGNTEVNAYVQISVNGEKVLFEKFEDVATGSPVYFTLTEDEASVDYIESEVEENATEVVNETVEEVVNETVEEVVEKDEAITGSVVDDGSGTGIPKFVYYIIGIIVIAVILVFFVVGRLNHRGKLAGTSGMKLAKVSAPTDYGAKLTEAENKIKAAQEEISRLRNQNKIAEMEKRIEKEREELERLKRGEGGGLGF